MIAVPRLGTPDVTPFPLVWPQWKSRTAIPTFSKFGQRTLAEALDFLHNEVRRLGATNPILSTNIPLGARSRPRTDLAEPQDRGVALYFERRGRDYVLACDTFRHTRDNVYAIGKHIEASRLQERYGVATLDQMLEGSRHLVPSRAPASSLQRPWWEVLKVSQDAPLSEITAAFESLAHTRHTDTGGSGDLSELVRARNEGRARAGT